MRIKLSLAFLSLIIIAAISKHAVDTSYAKNTVVSQRTQSQISKAEAFLSRAKLAIKDRKFRTAIDLLDKAIALIGDDYAGPNVDDDTGLALVLAQTEQNKQHYQRAAKRKQDVLEIRIHLLRSRMR